MVQKISRIALFVVSALALAAFTVLAARLLAEPGILDPSEQATLDCAERIAHGHTAYIEPAATAAQAPMPGFPFAVAVLARALEPKPWEPRAVALFAMLALAGLVLAIVRMETASWTLAVAAVGFALLGCGLLAGRPGLGRPETTMVLLVTLGFLVARVTNRFWGAVLAAVPLGAACFVDVQAAWFVGAAAVAMAVDGWRRLTAFVLAVGVVMACGYLAFSSLLGPWFNFYAWDAPLDSMRFDAAGLLHYVGNHLLGKLGVPTLAAVLSFALPTQPWRGKGGLWMCMGIAALVAGLAATQSTTFGPHALLPSVIALALIGPISMQRVTRHLSAWPGSSRLGGQGVVLAALSLQFIVLLSCASRSDWRWNLATAAPVHGGVASDMRRLDLPPR